MTDYELVVPSIWDYATEYLADPVIWVGAMGVSVATILFSRWYRRRRGWLD